jgi:hypothetical protein
MVDGYGVHLDFMQPVAPGVTAVRVHLTDAAGGPVSAARVQISQNLIAALSAGGHGGVGGDAHGDGADGGHDGASEGGHTEAGDAHGHTEAAGAPGDPNAEALPHTHDDSSLFQLTPGENTGTYGGSVIFFQAGQWAVHVEFRGEGEAEQHTAEFVVDVLPPDRGGLMLAAFAGVNAAIVGTAAVLKRKVPAA